VEVNAFHALVLVLTALNVASQMYAMFAPKDIVIMHVGYVQWVTISSLLQPLLAVLVK
jgi:hypothetical protein